jgi:hypothetical protein
MPAGPAPTTTTSQSGGGGPDEPRPIARPSSALLGLRRTSPPPVIATGGLLRLDGEPAEQRIRILVVIEVDPLVGHPVSRQKLPQAAGVGREARPDQLDPRSDIDQDRAARHECTEDQVAQRLVLIDDLAELVQGDLDHPACVADDPRQIEPLADEQTELTQEAVVPLDGDDLVLLPEALDDEHRSRLDDEEVGGLVSRVEQHLAGLDRAQPTELAESRELVLVKAGEGTVAVRGLLLPDPDLPVFVAHSRDFSSIAGTTWASWRQWPSSRSSPTKKVGVP